MSIHNFLTKLKGEGKRHVLMIVTPKGKYPNQFSGREYHELEQAILKNPSSYISLYEENVPEIMQFTSFRLFLKDVICDKKLFHNKTLTKVDRMNKDEITSFIVAEHFYDTVPYSEKSEEEAIKFGLLKAEEFLGKFPTDLFEFGTVVLSKDSDEANVFIKLDLKNESETHYFGYVYVR